MNTITSGAEVLVTASNAGQASESKVGQIATVLTASAIDDVKKSASQAQQYQSNADTATQQQQPLEHEQLEKVAQQLQDFMGEMNRSLQFQVDEDSGRDVIKVLDKATGDVIKQYPSEEVLSLVSKLSETAGLLIDQTV
ncbi:flagellar protein FlaG [Pseudoalteromonas nigrifaciens]|uniref:Flagellar protein FlaG n=1 Tax=Pseudoalteromonas nigrifaciens TaxID=28109 RepID=A0AAC9UGV4_9GAMM|nr:flagellar protein FlaG [Pseudoalteromonas nigrifaciens]ASM53184.1 flagellar protein FlaG [Pseudoalteromonas nigrifaciens]GEN40849.1 protein FlaG [Pseudoalteromonas nigrifaciens]SUC52952.1 flagellar protein FlaG [Pseudoalteromonas nigrifaciens]